MGSAEIDAVVQHDINDAKSLDIKGTPAVYVEGRHVNSLVAIRTQRPTRLLRAPPSGW
jgi:protein-disulfide isomerase